MSRCRIGVFAFSTCGNYLSRDRRLTQRTKRILRSATSYYSGMAPSLPDSKLAPPFVHTGGPADEGGRTPDSPGRRAREFGPAVDRFPVLPGHGLSLWAAGCRGEPRRRPGGPPARRYECCRSPPFITTKSRSPGHRNAPGCRRPGAGPRPFSRHITRGRIAIKFPEIRSTTNTSRADARSFPATPCRSRATPIESPPEGRH